MTWWAPELVNIVNINTNRLTQHSTIFQKSWWHLKILCVRSVTRSTSFTGDPHMLGARFSFTPGLTGTSRSGMFRETLMNLVEKSSVFYGSPRLTLTGVLIQTNQVPCRSHCFRTFYFNVVFSPAREFDGVLFPLSLSASVCYALLALSVFAAIRPSRLPLY